MSSLEPPTDCTFYTSSTRSFWHLPHKFLVLTAHSTPLPPILLAPLAPISSSDCAFYTSPAHPFDTPAPISSSDCTFYTSPTHPFGTPAPISSSDCTFYTSPTHPFGTPAAISSERTWFNHVTMSNDMFIFNFMKQKSNVFDIFNTSIVFGSLHQLQLFYHY